MAGFTFKSAGVVNQLAAPGAGNAIVPAFTASRNGIAHIVVSVDTATELAWKISDGTNAHECDLNSGQTLLVDTLYVWPVPVIKDYTYTLVIKTGSTDTTVQHAAVLTETPVG